MLSFFQVCCVNVGKLREIFSSPLQESFDEMITGSSRLTQNLGERHLRYREFMEVLTQKGNICL